MSRDDTIYDVVVVGGGNAALTAALAAAEAGARVVVIEASPRTMRGGNSRHTRNLRCAHDGPTDLLADAYTEEEFLADVVRVNSGDTDAELARLVVRESTTCPQWMRRFGVRFQSPLRGTLHLARTNAFFLGGGKAVMNSYYAAATRLGVVALYDAEVEGLEFVGGTFRSAHASVEGRSQAVRGRAAVVASGGFEANLEWLRSAWGEAADNFLVRGTPYNTGRPLRALLDAGARPVGDPRECHAVAIDARAPKFDGGIVTRLDCVPFGIVVNSAGERFYDEGEDAWPKRYAIWGTLVARQPGQIAYAVVDAKARGLFMPSLFPAFTAASVRELAGALGVPAGALERTVSAFNAHVRPGRFDHTALDDCRTSGLTPEKSHWARAIDTPPFLAYPLRPGITFTYLGVAVDASGRVLREDGAFANLYAAGEIMAGNILRHGYLAGLGMTIGTVFGRIAGRTAAQHATC
jgi:tricarballylate dehydrogenase